MAFLGPLNQKRLKKFRALRRGWVSFWILALLYVVSLGTELFIGSQPLYVAYGGAHYFPVFSGGYYPKTMFGGTVDIETDFRKLATDVAFRASGGRIVLTPHPFSPLESVIIPGDPPPSAPTARHPLGTDDRGRDILARLAYGFRISMTFALVLALVSEVVGIVVGAVQGYFGGWLDLGCQRLIEIWTALPFLYVVLMVSSVVTPNFWILIGILALFRWIPISRYVRAEVFRERARDYVTASRAQGASSLRSLFVHVLPNSLTPVIALFPFTLVASIFALTSLDYLGFGLPAPTPSWGELFKQGQTQLTAWWLTFFPFLALFTTLLLTTFVGEALREAWDPRDHHRREE